MQKQHNAEYFEAIIQIRPLNKEVIEYVFDLIKKRRDVFVSKTNFEKYGCDIYISDQRYAKSIGKRLKARFKGGILKKSMKLHSYSRIKSKKIYRVTICFRYENENQKDL
ncbi:hypothetical protein J4409_01375 [Candidatus Woesearchaeota archaeon]|nr:hypothetical protein [Candidatus Woesearchaeota archaeon]